MFQFTLQKEVNLLQCIKGTLYYLIFENMPLSYVSSSLWVYFSPLTHCYAHIQFMIYAGIQVLVHECSNIYWNAVIRLIAFHPSNLFQYHYKEKCFFAYAFAFLLILVCSCWSKLPTQYMTSVFGWLVCSSSLQFTLYIIMILVSLFPMRKAWSINFSIVLLYSLV